jgi:hypothetical protein
VLTDILYFLGISLVVSVVCIALKEEEPAALAFGTLKLFLMIAGGIAAFCVVVQVLQAALQ